MEGRGRLEETIGSMVGLGHRLREGMIGSTRGPDRRRGGTGIARGIGILIAETIGATIDAMTVVTTGKLAVLISPTV